MFQHFKVCGEAENGVEAVEVVTRLCPDVVVLNVTMPLMNGFEAAREIKKDALGTAIVILSSYADKHFVAAAQKSVCKPMSPNLRSGKPW
jgi:two-component system, NarL family, response regulator